MTLENTERWTGLGCPTDNSSVAPLEFQSGSEIVSTLG
jgi:hypothetical protein